MPEAPTKNAQTPESIFRDTSSKAVKPAAS